MRDYFEANRDLAGILREQVLEGPRHVVIDITNRCNTNCVACWTYSPLLKKENRPEKSWYRKELSKEALHQLIEDLCTMGVERVRFTGGGEPFLHPHIMDALRWLKARGVWTAVTTNGIRLNEKICQELRELKVDEIAISLWAASEESYRDQHPSAKEGVYWEILENVRRLKIGTNFSPRVSFLNVINKKNVHEISRMGDLARNLAVDSVYFTLVDLMPDTRELLLSEEERVFALKEVKRIEARFYNRRDELEWDNLHGFAERLKNVQEESQYDTARIDAMPCYMGWHFCRVLADGGIAPCCKGVDYIMGNVHEARFRDIWVSAGYGKFRNLSLKEKKNHPYFLKMNCYQMCDNLMHNEQIHERLQALSDSQKNQLRNADADILQDLSQDNGPSSPA